MRPEIAARTGTRAVALCSQLWAKAAPTGRWHALPCHLLDVAATAEALWDRLPRDAKSLCIDALGDEAVARQTCVFLAGAHDVGKANRFFQAKDAEQHNRLIALGVDLPGCSPDDHPRHGQATGAHLKPWLIDRWHWSGHVADAVALAVGGHHGTFFGDTKQTTLGVDAEPWCTLGRTLLDGLAEALPGPRAPCEPTPLNVFLGWLSGFVCVADWLGSHVGMTTWQTAAEPWSSYLGEATPRARALLDDLRWQAPPCTRVLSVAEMLPRGGKPNALQELAREVAPAFSLAIIEAPTGEGKTEAAFALAEPRRSQGAGIYFALPTMATANGLHGRVVGYLRSASAGADQPARLLHSRAWLFREGAQTAPDPGIEGIEQDTKAQDWFAGPKRGLIAPYGVGTIDQALIAALRARHGFVRLFALAGKTVVIDEVHAYDVYMADLLDVLLGWLRALRCQVVLLSATLPSARRNALLRAWGADTASCRVEYPAMTWVGEDARGRTQTFATRQRKPLTLGLLATGGAAPWARGASAILDSVRARGGLGALVLNTVYDAQQAFDWLSAQQLAGVGVDLFHARFTAQDRHDIEGHVLAIFGREGARNCPGILVATQVVEQSLDLDFDHMVSALAPIDLLIQRAGRLHRHPRGAGGRLRADERDDRPDPVLRVLAPHTGSDGLPLIEDPVYSHDVLMRTLDRLGSNSRIARTADICEAVEAVYGEAQRPAILSAWESRLIKLEARTAQGVARDRQQARRSTIGAADDDELVVESFLDLDENDERQGSQLAARTRLEDRPSVTVAMLREQAGQMVTVHGAAATDPRAALFASVRITPPYPLWEGLLDLEPLPAWARRGSLARVRPLVLKDGGAVVGGYQLRYDERRGLDWRKLDGVIQA